jgi:hypothetical protein
MPGWQFTPVSCLSVTCPSLSVRDVGEATCPPFVSVLLSLNCGLLVPLCDSGLNFLIYTMGDGHSGSSGNCDQ